MLEKQYNLLRGYWKNLFDFFAIKQPDGNYLSPYKLKYNENLFKVFFKDQRQNYKRPKDNYEKIAHDLYVKSEREVFVGNSVTIDIDNILAAIDSSIPLVTRKIVREGDFQYPKIISKLSVSTLTLNDNELDFLSSVIPSLFSSECSYLILNYAEIPLTKKFNKRKGLMLERHTLSRIKNIVNLKYLEINNKKAPFSLRKKMLIEYIESLYITYFI